MQVNSGQVYQKLPVNVDLNILQPGDVHNRVDIVRSRCEDDLSISAALCECLQDCWSIISHIASATFDYAALSMAFSSRGTE